MNLQQNQQNLQAVGEAVRMDRIIHMLGLATKAGKTQSGTFLTEDAVRARKARLVLIAEDAEANTRKTLEDKCRSYHVPVVYAGTKEQLGQAMGKGIRSCAAILDSGFAQSISKLTGACTQEGRE